MAIESVEETFTQADIDAAYERGHQEGYESGIDSASDSSWQSGYDEGRDTGYEDGNKEGHTEEFNSMKMIITNLLTKRKIGSYISVADIELLDDLLKEVNEMKQDD